MTDAVVSQISSPSDAEIDFAIDFLDAVFAKSEFHMMAVGRDLTVSRLFMAWVVNAGFENGEVYFAKGTVEGTEKVLGVVVWFPPGRSVDNNEGVNQQWMDPYLASFSPEMSKWNSEVFMHTMHQVEDDSFGKGYKLANYHLQLIGISEDARGKGISRRVIETVKAKAHAQGVSLCLEATSEQNANIYERLGFKRMGEGTITGAPRVSGEETFFCMVCEP